MTARFMIVSVMILSVVVLVLMLEFVQPPAASPAAEPSARAASVIDRAAEPAALSTPDGSGPPRPTSADGAVAHASGNGGAGTQADATATVLPVPLDANPQVAATVEAALTRTHPERLDVHARPTPWDKAAFMANPHAYLDVVEPGRVWMTAAPGAGPAIQVQGPVSATVAPGGSVTLQVRAVPGSMVSYSSLDLGAFPNRLTAISIATDAHGLASTDFIATSGTTDDVNIMAACPETVGQVHFVVHIRSRAITTP